MSIAVRCEPWSGPLREVAYRWDEDTDILSASLSPIDVARPDAPVSSDPVPAGGVWGAASLSADAAGRSTTIEIEGSDGSWLILDLTEERINGVEVAVWPEVRKRSALAPPAGVEPRVVFAARRSPPQSLATEVDTRISAESDAAERTIHFRLGVGRATRTVGLARDLLLDLDARERIVGVWLLNVPPVEGSA